MAVDKNSVHTVSKQYQDFLAKHLYDIISRNKHCLKIKQIIDLVKFAC